MLLNSLTFPIFDKNWNFTLTYLENFQILWLFPIFDKNWNFTLIYLVNFQILWISRFPGSVAILFNILGILLHYLMVFIKIIYRCLMMSDDALFQIILIFFFYVMLGHFKYKRHLNEKATSAVVPLFLITLG